MNLSGKNIGSSCDGIFKDMPKEDWGCKYAESASAFGFITKNSLFRPNDNVTKIEAIKMIFKANNISILTGNDWRKSYVDKGVELGLFSDFNNYDEKATRGFIFEISAKILDGVDEDIDLSGIFDDL